MKYIALLPLILGCSHIQKKESFTQEIEDGNISSLTILDLARSSYLRGCVDGKNEFASSLKKSAFNRCLEMAKLHEEDIKTIINSDIKKNPAK